MQDINERNIAFYIDKKNAPNQLRSEARESRLTYNQRRFQPSFDAALAYSTASVGFC